MKCLKEIWIGFANAVLPRNATKGMVADIKKSFYSGFTAGMVSAIEAATVSDTEEEAHKRLESLFMEVANYQKQVEEQEN